MNPPPDIEISFIFGNLSGIALIGSSPSFSGMTMSVITRSGFYWLQIDSASRPFWATTSSYPTGSNICLSKDLTISSSQL
ncbi:MAG: hypothetical protein JRJ23_00480 [Deltaproteobacteria bacterium]|nr:hypothetical protein [Deltaproteobacteria bacterium]MBW1914608.1 hypothetical protein [Deltaproteobacteria bacterium]